MRLKPLIVCLCLLHLLACDRAVKKIDESKVKDLPVIVEKYHDSSKSISNYTDAELDVLVEHDTIKLIPDYDWGRMIFFSIKKIFKGTKAFNDVLMEDRKSCIEWAQKYKDNIDNQFSVLDYISDNKMSFFKKTMLDKNMKNGHTEFRNYILINGKAVSVQFKDLFKKDLFIHGLNYDFKSDSILLGVPDELKVDCLNFGNLVKGNGNMTEVPQIEFAFHKEGIQIHFLRIVSSDGFYPLYKFIYEYESKVISYKLLKPYLRDDFVF